MSVPRQIIKSICFPLLISVLFLALACSKEEVQVPAKPSPVPASFSFSGLKVNGSYSGFEYYDVKDQPVVRLQFSAAIDRNSAASNIQMKDKSGSAVNLTAAFENHDSSIVIQPVASLKPISQYTLSVSTGLLSQQQGKLQSPITIKLITAIDSADKFPRISDEELLDLVEKQTFKYFWDLGHPLSGLARERNTSGDIVTTGGSGFGIMAIVAATNRGFITREDGLARMQKIVGFLKDKAETFHGAYPHWMNGSTGKVLPFGQKDDGADLVETSYLMQGLLTARQYFAASTAAESSLRLDINQIWERVDWNWFRKNNENVLYWHWSPNYGWAMNMPIHGWDEALITYVMAASSPSHAITKEVYDAGWAQDGRIRNGNSYYGIKLPMGPANGGPLFFEHYSFLGINPMGLTDNYANYQEQTKAHTLINYNYCKANPRGYYGYSESCWGLTASDDINGYLAHEPNNDNGVISPTAALSSFPYTPDESMRALKFFYYKLGDKLWKDYGFVDAFSLKDTWFADSFLAIDQGPIMIMIENQRTGLLWNLFMSCPEVKTGMKNLGFQSPKL